MNDKLVPLKNCPIGLFICEDTLCLKTEYNNESYIVWSGECFCGGIDTLVLPIPDSVVVELEDKYRYE